MAAIAGMRLAAVAKFPLVIRPCASTIAPSLRGKNSYQAPTSARSRSARTGISSERLTKRRNGFAAK